LIYPPVNETWANFAGHFVASDHIRYVEESDCIVVLDCRKGRYEVADEVATSMWNCLVGTTSLDRQIGQWHEDYGLTADMALDEIRKFAQACERGGLLRRKTGFDVIASNAGAMAAPRSMPWRVPRIVLALFYIVSTSWSLRTKKFSPTYRRCAAVASPTGQASPEKPIRTFLRAENIVGVCRSADDCLVRSLSLFRYLRACGVPAEHVIGVRRIPFDAHAWVEVGGVPMLDRRGDGFAPIARLAADSAG
jgi:Transglutaminase-like superfamily